MKTTGTKSKMRWLGRCVVALAILGTAAVTGSQAGSLRASTTVIVEAESAATRTVGGSDGPGWNLWSDGHIAETIEFGESRNHRVVVRARGNDTGGSGPTMELRIDGRTVATTVVQVSRTWAYEDYTFEVAATPGPHEVAIAHVDDPRSPERDVDLVIDRFTVTPIAEVDAATNPDAEPVPTSAVTATTTVPLPAPPPSATAPPPAPPPSTTMPPPSTTVPPASTTRPPASTTTPPPSVTSPEPPAPPAPAPPSPAPAPPAPPAPAPGGPRSPYVPAGYRLTWNDEFDSLSLDLEGDGGENWGTYFTGWNVRSLAGNSDQCMKADPSYTGTGGRPLGIETHRIDDGVLTLFGRPIPQDRRGQFWNYQAACGMITGQRSHAQTYGYWEVRMRITNVSTGHHWAIWLLPENDTWPPEVDILEVVGLDPRKFHFTGHYNDRSGRKRADMAYRNAPGAAGDWYTLGLEWSSDAVVWYLDGVEVHRMSNFIGTAPNYFLISPEIGGNWPGPTNGSTSWPMSMDVDYVRIYSN